MKFTTENHGEWLEVQVEGRLDALTADQFVGTIRSIAKEGNTTIRVDATQVNYISSAGLRALLMSYRELQAVGGTFGLIKASEIVESTLKMSGMQLLLLNR